MFRLGAIGAGKVFEAYDRATDTLRNVKIVAVADPNRERLSAVARGGRQLFTDVDDLLLLPIDAVLVLTPNACHASLVRQCIARGFDTLCEKPLATSVEEAQELLALSAAQGTFLSVAMHCRYRPEVKYLTDNIRGEVEYFLQIYHEHWMLAPRWYFDPVQSGGGVLLDVGINQIDWIIPFTRPVRPETVQMEFGDADVELDCRIDWQHRNGKGTTVLSWRAIEEQKTTSIITNVGDVFELDHQNHMVIHNGKRRGPWRSMEYSEVLKDFIEQRDNPTARKPTNAKEVLTILRGVYDQVGLPFLSSSSRGNATPPRGVASRQRIKRSKKAKGSNVLQPDTN